MLDKTFEGIPAERVLADACSEMEQRLRSGDTCTSEEMLQLQPGLADDPDAVLELVYYEYVVREELGEDSSFEAWYRRFPDLRENLAKVFEIHEQIREEDEEEENSRSTMHLVQEMLADRPSAEPDFEGYKILGQLGRGSMGVVYKARQPGLNRVVALKKLLAGADASPEERARFRAEAEAVARLEHPNIVRIHEVGVGEAPYLSLEYVAGGTLQDRLARNPMTSRESAELVRPLALALESAHRSGIVHRDAKPGNVLLTPEGVPKLTDFGLAKLVDADRDHTKTGTQMGTPAYMAPEQAEGRGKEVGPLVDVYALGAILFECLTGRPPFRGATILETLDLVRTQEPILPSKLQPSVDHDLETICLKCLEKEPTRRYPSAGELAEDLRRYLDGEPIHARPVRLWEKAIKWMRRHPLPTAFAVILLGVIATSFAVVLSQLRTTREALHGEATAREKAERGMAIKSVALARHYWGDNKVSLAREVLDDCPIRHRDSEWRLLHFQCNAERHRFAIEGKAGKIPLLWTADGTRVFAGVRSWDVVRGVASTPTQPASTPPSTVGTQALGNNPLRLYYVSRDHPKVFGIELQRWRVYGFDPKNAKVETLFELTKPKGATFTQGSLNSDGSLFGFVHFSTIRTKSRIQTIEIYDVKTGQQRISLEAPLKESVYFGSTILFSRDNRRIAFSNIGTPNQIVVCDLATRTHRVLATLEQMDPRKRRFQVRFSVPSWSPDGTRLYTSTRPILNNGTRELYCWDVESGRLLYHRSLPMIVPNEDSYAVGTRYVACAVFPHQIHILDASSGKTLFSLRGHTDEILSLAFDSQERQLASLSKDGELRIWNVRPPAVR